jgi:hypothetical protein
MTFAVYYFVTAKMGATMHPASKEVWRAVADSWLGKFRISFLTFKYSHNKVGNYSFPIQGLRKACLGKEELDNG